MPYLNIFTFLISIFFIVPLVSAEVRYNDAQFTSSHNSYSNQLSIREQLDEMSSRSLELDIYQNKYWFDTIKDNWYVFHFRIFDTRTHCNTLSDCLLDLKSYHQQNPNHEVITLWVDLKDTWTKHHSPAQFDKVLLSNLPPDSVFSPQSLLGTCPSIQSLQRSPSLKSVIKDCGWPDLLSLRGKFLIVLTTGQVTPESRLYQYKQIEERMAFVAGGISDRSQITRYDQIVFNLSSDSLHLAQEIQRQQYISRTYLLNDEETFAEARKLEINHLATDYIHLPWAKLTPDYR